MVPTFSNAVVQVLARAISSEEEREESRKSNYPYLQKVQSYA